MTVRVWDEAPAIADRRAFDVEVALKDRGFGAEKARISAVTSILADIRATIRSRERCRRCSLRAVRMSPVTGISRGEVTTASGTGPRSMLGYSERGIPVRLAFQDRVKTTATWGSSGRAEQENRF